MLDTKLVLVTGASGWLGTRLLHFLVHGLKEHPYFQANPQMRIRCLVKKGEILNITPIPGRISVVYGDVRETGSLEAFFKGAERAILFHVAGIIHPKYPKEFIEINVTGTRNLLTAASNAKIKRAVIVSSNSPCGCNPHVDHLFDESSPYNPYMGYGRSKMLMETVANENQMFGKKR